MIKERSDRELVEKSLEESEQRFRTIFESASDGILVVDVETKRFLLGNRMICSMLEYSNDEIKNLTVMDIHPEEDLPRVLDQFEKLARGEITLAADIPVKRRDGGVFYADINSSWLTLDGKKYMAGIFRDVTGRKKAEEALKESEDHYRTIISAVTDYIFTVRVENGRPASTLHSPACIAVTGYTSEEFAADPYLWLNMVVETDREMVIEHANRVLSGSDPGPIQHRITRKDGVIRWVKNTPVLHRNESGTLIAYDGLIRDITDRKHAEDTMLNTLSLLNATLQSTADGILVVDSAGKIEAFNRKFVQMWRIPESIINSRDDDKAIMFVLDQLKDPEGFLSKVRELYSQPDAESYDVLVFKDGRVFERYSQPQKIGGNVVGRVWSFRDVTDQKRAEDSLRESEQKYRSLFEESKDVVYISTRAGKFLDINNAGVELFGYSSKEELLQIDIPRDLYVNPGDRILFQNLLLKQGYVKDYEVVFRKKEGEHVTVLLTATAVPDETGEITAYRGIMKDITERKRLEEQLLQAQKMEAIGQLAGGIAHDFNNILTAIIGFGNLLKMETEKDDPLRSYITQILDSAARAANLTQALLAFSRKQIISPKPVNLNEIIKGIDSLLSRLIGEDVELSTMLTDKDLIIMADSGQIDQVLMNLATNSRDAMPDGGRLIIRTELTEFDSEFVKAHGFGQPGHYALIAVEDTGHGMDEETRERIFEPFFTTKDVGKGTGLGLAMAYGIIKQHNGYITVYSELNEGTIFKIYLPLIKSKVTDTALTGVPTPMGGKETILVAEDNDQVRELIRKVLSGYGYEVLEAVDGEDAIRIFKRNRDSIQLLILDVVMPKKNGKEVYKQIKRERPDMEAIFTSGYTADIVHNKGILEKGLNFILKPLSPEELLTKVRKVLDKIER